MSQDPVTYPTPVQSRFFGATLAETDPDLLAALKDELVREQDQIELIASENIVSKAVLEAQGQILRELAEAGA